MANSWAGVEKYEMSLDPLIVSESKKGEKKKKAPKNVTCEKEPI